MHRKGQSGPIGLIILDVFFVIMWALWLGAWLSTIGADAIAQNHITGFEAFLWGNLNLWVFLGLLLGNLIFFATGGGD